MVTTDSVLELKQKFPNAYKALQNALLYAKQQHGILLTAAFRSFINNSQEVNIQIKKLLADKGFIEKNGSPCSGLIQVLTTIT